MTSTPCNSCKKSLESMDDELALYQSSPMTRSALDLNKPCPPINTGIVSTFDPGRMMRATIDTNQHRPASVLKLESCAPKPRVSNSCNLGVPSHTCALS